MEKEIKIKPGRGIEALLQLIEQVTKLYDRKITPKKKIEYKKILL